MRFIALHAGKPEMMFQLSPDVARSVDVRALAAVIEHVAAEAARVR